MSVRRLIVSLGVVLAAAGCSEAAGPAGPVAGPNAPIANVSGGSRSTSQMHILKQSPAAPRLETYRTSFWAYKGKSSNVRVQYQSGSGAANHNFLQFVIPRNGLASGANGARLASGDSVRITLSIDPATFAINFQPSGVQFGATTPATLQMWFQDADPDLNGDGVVNTTDDRLAGQLGTWTAPDGVDSWTTLPYVLDSAGKSVTASVYHFSDYAISW